MRITFATLAIPPAWEQESLLLVESLREFGGQLADSPFSVWSLPDRPVSQTAAGQLQSMNAELHTFEMEEPARKFPLAIVPFGAAAAEAHHQTDTDVLVWLLPDTLILQPPQAFALPDNKRLAYRPVHHQNVGSPLKDEIGPFWAQVYIHCDVSPERLFPMRTCYGEMVRPYFNAGVLAVRPQDNLCHAWRETFRRTYQHPDFTPFFEQPKYAIFMHQAILSGVILNVYEPAQMAELPESYNYPLHMHAEYPQSGKATKLADLITARYENTRVLPDFLDALEDDDGMKNLWGLVNKPQRFIDDIRFQ